MIIWTSFTYMATYTASWFVPRQLASFWSGRSILIAQCLSAISTYGVMVDQIGCLKKRHGMQNKIQNGRLCLAQKVTTSIAQSLLRKYIKAFLAYLLALLHPDPMPVTIRIPCHYPMLILSRSTSIRLIRFIVPTMMNVHATNLPPCKTNHRPLVKTNFQIQRGPTHQNLKRLAIIWARLTTILDSVIDALVLIIIAITAQIKPGAKFVTDTTI